MPKVVDHDVYRKELLEKCRDLFAAKGYGSLTMRQIADSLGVSTGTLYHYFPNKESLFTQFVNHVTSQHILDAQPEIASGKTLQERIRKLFDHIDSQEEQCKKDTRIFLNYLLSQDSEEGKAAFEDVNQRYRKAGQELLGISDPEVASLIICVIDGITLERMHDREISFAQMGNLLSEMISIYLEVKSIEQEFV